MKLRSIRLRHTSAAFTLMEMMLVLLIITLIIGSVAIAFQNFSGGAQITTTQGKVRSLEAAIMNFKIQNGFTPSQSQGLEALVTPPSDPRVKMRAPLVKADALMDPWEKKMQYRNPGKKNPQGIDVFSFGPDGVESADDIGNW
jgi:general secretion pathway protein G